MNMKSFRIIMSKLKNPMSYEKYLLKYDDKIKNLCNSIYADKLSYIEDKDEFDDLTISMYKKN